MGGEAKETNWTKSSKRQPFDAGDPAYASLAIYAHDERWARELLADAGVRDAILRLTAAPGPFELVNLLVQPDALQLKRHHTPTQRITPEAVRQWLADMLSVVRAAEGLPPPAELLQPSGLETSVRTRRGAMSSRIMLITLGVILFGMVCPLLVLIPVLILAMRGP